MFYVTISYVDIRHRTYIRCRIRYGPTISYVMYIRHRTSISNIRHCIRYAEMLENVRCRMCHIRCRMLMYDIVRDVRCCTYDVVRLYPVYRTYDIVRTMFNTISYVARTMSYVHDVRCMTYDIVRDVRHRRWQESRWVNRHENGSLHHLESCTQAQPG
jgi:hypothetical protein